MGEVSQIELVRTQIVNLNLKTKELIQEIQNCGGPIDVLEDLNEKGRYNINLLRQNITLLKTLANEVPIPDTQRQLMEEIKINEDELSATLTAFKKANFATLLTIDKANREELLKGDEESFLKHRKKKDKESLCGMTTNVTDQLISISGNLYDSVQRSASTLDTLVNSSATADGTKVELSSASNAIAKSGKLLSKYGRREKTDKVLVFFAFMFFLVCVVYVIHKRLF